MPTKTTQEKFIQHCNEKHNNKYDYSLVEYKEMHTKIKIICPIHGEFTQTPHFHLKNGCRLCKEHKNRKTHNEFIQDAKKIHGDKYDYSKTKYLNASHHLEIICPTHGSFWQTAKNHICNKTGCRKCKSENERKLVTEFIEQCNSIHEGIYDYSKVKYINLKTKIVIECLVHGEFKQQAGSHLKGQGCPKCHGTFKLTLEEFIKKSRLKHQNMYDYSKVNYVNRIIPVEIVCLKHGSFWQTPACHYYVGQGCPKCYGSVSHMEQIWLNSINLPDDSQHRQCTIKIDEKKYKVDGFDPITNTVYEFLGDYWHGNPIKYKTTDYNVINKTTFGQLHDETFQRFDLLEQAGYKVVYIWENDFKQTQKNITKRRSTNQ